VENVVQLSPYFPFFPLYLILSSKCGKIAVLFGDLPESSYFFYQTVDIITSGKVKRDQNKCG